MTMADRWLLPDGIDEVLPPLALRMESLRRALLDLYHRWGYDLVVPPPVEFLDSLLTGTGSDLELQTFKLTDQASGRMMGLSADVTPQVARMDAHSLRRPGPSRLCYCANALRATADQYQGGRNPVQLGLELFGHSGIDADLEIVRLALESLYLAGATDVHLAFGHIGIYRVLTEAAGLDAALERDLFEAIERKAYTEIDALLEEAEIDASLRHMLARLPRLHGGLEVITEAREAFVDMPEEISAQLEQFEHLARRIGAEHPEVELYFDLAELRGYQYHTGVVFAAYVPGYGQALVKGGRYDDTGRAFGRSRPATGCSMELKLLAGLREQLPPCDGIWAPAGENGELEAVVAKLRAAGERVVQALPGQVTGPLDHRCNRRLERIDGEWRCVPLDA
ncbi:ATP phosphoribosyltransferase regulatory subunit [Halotalea alkalilenta]|uniref:ATP phosphoribosyltransferase regulatory subunit n=1 Tax=Halotalea alkalilenta TaxID=376489 RepID=UPI0004864E1D|nr:ATP phosphoribosyltransferase regulatory subunit [Halotalea alkalilenta]